MTLTRTGSACVDVDRCLSASRTTYSPFAGWLLAGLLLAGGSAQVMAAPVHLRTEGRVNPLGIDEAKPVFAWQSDAAERGWKQSAYEVMVAESAEGLRAGRLVWDSGRKESGESVGIAYAGPGLKARQRYFWAVKVWDAKGGMIASTEPAWWETGLAKSEDWKAQWIRREDAEATKEWQSIRWIGRPGADADGVMPGTKVEYSYVLHLDAKPAAATMHVLSTGTFMASVNGTETGTKEEWSAFDREEIRDLLHVGENTIRVSIAMPSAKGATKTAPAVLAAVIRLTKADGKTVSVVTDGSWKSGHASSQGTGAAMEDVQPAKDLGGLAALRVLKDSDRSTPAAAPDRVESMVSLFRKEFTPRGKVVAARLYCTAMGSYEASLNGKKVGQSMLVPGFTDYRKRVLYQTYDVTAMVGKGANVLGARLGAGWHGSPLLWVGVREFAGPDLLRAQLELTYADGTRETVATDDSWKTAAAPTGSSEIYGGEAYDARLERAEWDTVSAKNAGWAPAVVGSVDAKVAVTAEADEAIHAAEKIVPVKVTEIGKDSVFDMGQNMVGVVKLRVKGPRGTIVRLRFAERLKPDGSIYTQNLRDADATDYYTLKGGGEEVWMPAFTFHGFRYVQVSGLPGKAVPATLEGVVLNSLPMQPSIKLDTSSELLNHMNELGLWGQRGNFVSIPTDCPQRDERMGWMGDAGVFWRTGSYNFDIDPFSHKFMQDVVDAQNPDGSFANISPNLLMGSESDPGAPGWGDAGVLVPHATWLQYGDTAIVERNWAAMERWMDYILKTNPNHVRAKELGANYADWLAPDPHTPSDLVATAYWALLARQMGEMATALGRTEDAAKYHALYGKIQAAYRAKYVHADGSVEGNTQSAYVLTLYTGMAPKSAEKGMTSRLVELIAAKDNHLTTGFLGTPFLLSVLDEQGRVDVAYKLLLNTTYPSWGYMVQKGATTWWERWNGDTGDPSMNSYNHYAFGSVMAWVYRRAAGIDTDVHGPGYHHVVISPHVDAGLTHAHAEYDSAYGMVMTDWSTDGAGVLTLKVKVPANASASVVLPEGVAEMDGGRVKEGVVQVGAGTYGFVVRR